MRLYLGGQMNGLVKHGHDVFDEAAYALRMMGHEVFNPADHDRDNGWTPDHFNRREALTSDMAWIGAHSEGMILLENWRSSPGAKAELTFHHALGLPAWELNDFFLYGTDAPTVEALVPPKIYLTWGEQGHFTMDIEPCP